MNSRERGAVLIVVLWVLALLVVLLAAFSSSVRVDRQVSSELIIRAKGRAATDAVLAYLSAMHRLGGDQWTELPGQVLLLPGADRARFRMIPEEAYVSLAGASPELLGLLLEGISPDGVDSAMLVESILARRQGLPPDEDGSEVPFSPLRSIDELLLLPGFNRELLDRLAPLVTVDSAHEGVAVEFASWPLLRVLAGDRAADLSDRRADESFRATDYVSPELAAAPGGSLYRLQVEVGERPDRRKIEVTVMFGEGKDGYRIVRWNEYTARFDLD
ncbi:MULTISPECIES: type II secretion system protein GspK [unclassified Pseudomonas]|uniref:type II secretion system protein GspK n=1 Tax=unclassified Pseudomonas TaxID=196821 RepID=UPI00244A7143|nr:MULTISPECIES: type II secretion system protein GspK [unclassified Pseudomonas]MDH0896631.1 general secretion pathway protein GspK [Pseudomonas sp. GD03875]MDH1066428.1 general secretion pathway protein GspK [Pseudomonas sp. GD03985]